MVGYLAAMTFLEKATFSILLCLVFIGWVAAVFTNYKIRKTRLLQNASVKSLDFDLGLEDSDLRTPT